MPDVLGISQDALCPDVTCKLAQNETGLAEPCEHQLDLLVVSVLCLKCSMCEIKSLPLVILFILNFFSDI